MRGQKAYESRNEMIKMFDKIQLIIKRIIVEIYYSFRPILRICMFGLPINNKKVVLDNFMGQEYGDTAKCIADALIEKEDNWDIVWLTNDPSMILNGIRCVKYDSYRALYEMATAKVWIDNIRNTYKPIKKRKQIYLQTWHGCFPSKKIEAQECKLSKVYVRKAKQDGKMCDGILTGNPYCYKIMDNYFWLSDKTERLKISPPRDDILFNSKYLKKTQVELRYKLNISEEAYVLLYAPTFRDDNSLEGFIKDFKKIVHAVKKVKKCDVIVLSRFHPNTHGYQVPLGGIDVTNYPNINDLFVVSNMVITDYSSVGCEFVSLLRKPAILYMPDLKEYLKNRELSDLIERSKLPRANTMEELIEILLKEETYVVKEEMNELELFNPGKGTSDCIRWIYSKL